MNLRAVLKNIYNIHKLLSLLTKREKWKIRQINKLIESEMNKETSQQAPRRLRTLKENTLKSITLLSWKQ